MGWKCHLGYATVFVRPAKVEVLITFCAVTGHSCQTPIRDITTRMCLNLGTKLTRAGDVPPGTDARYSSGANTNMTDQDPKAQLGYRLYWKRIALHLNLRDIAKELDSTSVAISNFEKGDFTRLTREQLLAYLTQLDMIDKSEDYLALMPESLEA